ncbi:unnamed protein product [Mycena citricolor]|uniref:SGNH hydrolase-type esterase domain-containing protein n=1 Tax=Mycena citricolor TaxID=2018698 RepID=A0AAD2HXG8_9AGAR|nr:unnamed protein product [Mycena citricolor]
MRAHLSAAALALLFARLAMAGPKNVTISNTDPLVYFHGRWDTSPGTWWAGSGFKLHVANLQSLALSLGPHTTQPNAAVGVSVDYGAFITANVSAGVNQIPLPPSALGKKKSEATVVRVNVEGWQANRINLEEIILNEVRSVLGPVHTLENRVPVHRRLSVRRKPFASPPPPARAHAAQGQFLPKGVDQAWPFLVGEQYKAEHVVVAQPGAALTDIFSYGNAHGLSFQFFRTEDTGYYYTTDHNYTTPWDFSKDTPATHLVIHIGANDSGQNVPADQFVQVYTDFLARLRSMREYAHVPIFVLSPWGWPSADAPTFYYYPGEYEKIRCRTEHDDKNIFLVNTTGWVTFADVFPDNQHPTVAGHAKIAGEFQTWLENWGLHPHSEWRS